MVTWVFWWWFGWCYWVTWLRRWWLLGYVGGGVVVLVF